MLRRLISLPRRRLVVQIVGLSAVLVALVIAYYATVSYQRDRWQLKARFGRALRQLAEVTAAEIDGDAHRTITGPDDAAARRVTAHLQRVGKATRLGEAYQLYTVHLPAAGEPPAYRVAAYPGQPDRAGQAASFDAVAAEALGRAIDEGNSAYSDLYDVGGRELVSAFAIISDSAGHAVGVVVGQQDVSTEAGNRLRLSLTALATSSVALLAALLLGAFLARGIGRALRRIRDAARAIERADYGHRVEVVRQDELGMVARQFNAMAEALAERVHLLKFLPAYTFDAVVARSRGLSHSEAETREGSVLFSDIRGYTSLSEGIEPEAIVAMLNVYLRRQAELLARQGGVVDKFIGDAVLASFMGEDHARRAVAAALEIQAAIREMNDAGAFAVPIRVGIGVASGTLLLAEIGSEARRERTLIGSVVNLASRLCSHAGAGEVVVNEATRAALGDATPVVRSEDVALKGFKLAQACHWVRGA